MTLLQTAWGSTTVRCGRRPRTSRRHRPSRSTTETGATPGPVAGRGSTAPTWSPTALDLVVRDGPGALTMRRLATELDVGTPTIYWHVGSRDELVAAVVRIQSERLAERPVEGATARDRVFSAAVHIYAGAIEHRAITSLAHQAGMDAVLLHHLEAALVAELEAAGLVGEACADAVRAILVVVTGALVLALRDPSRFPEAYRSGGAVGRLRRARRPRHPRRAPGRSRPRRPDRRHAAGRRRPPRARAGRPRPERPRRQVTQAPMTEAPMTRPGEIAGWPKLVVTYTTDPARVAALLPPGPRAARARRHRRLLLRAGARRARVRREREGGGGLEGRRRPVQPRARHRPGGRRPRQRRDQRAAQVPVRHRLLPLRRPGHGPGQPPGLHVRRVHGHGHRRGRATRRRGRRARVVDQVLARHRRRRGRLRLPAPRRRRGHDLRAAPRRGRRRRSSCCATARGTRSPGTSRSASPAMRSW